MSQYKLSVLILTTSDRQNYYDNLISILDQQVTSAVQVLTNSDDNKNIPIKRNELLNQATGDYICFIDDDDEVSDNYISEILTALDTDPDFVKITMEKYIDGRMDSIRYLSLDNSLYTHHDSNNNVIAKRTFPCHLNPVKRSIALAVGFKESLDYGEDTDYSKRLRIRLKTEANSNAMYKYLFRRVEKGYNFGYRTYHI